MESALNKIGVYKYENYIIPLMDKRTVNAVVRGINNSLSKNIYVDDLEDITEEYLLNENKEDYKLLEPFEHIILNTNTRKDFIKKKYNFFSINKHLYFFSNKQHALNFFLNSKFKGIKELSDLDNLDVTEEFFENPFKFKDLQHPNGFVNIMKNLYIQKKFLNPYLGQLQKKQKIIYFVNEQIHSFNDLAKAENFFKNNIKISNFQEFEITQEYYANPEKWETTNSNNVISNNELKNKTQFYLIDNKIFIFPSKTKTKTFFKDTIETYKDFDITEAYLKEPEKYSEYEFHNIDKLSVEKIREIQSSFKNSIYKEEFFLIGDLILSFKDINSAIFYFNKGLIRNHSFQNLEKYNITSDIDNKKYTNYKRIPIAFDTVISKEDITKIMNFKSHSNINTNKTEKKLATNIVEPIIINDTKNVNKTKKKSGKKLTLQEKFLDYRKNISMASKKFKKNWICSIDTEYKRTKTGKVLLKEIGYTLKHIKNRKTINKHFLIKDNINSNCTLIKPIKTFSEILPLKEVLEIVRKDLNKCELIVGNNINVEKKILNLHGIQIPENKFFELSSLISYLIKDDRNIKLGSIFSMATKNEPIYLHNASNDAYYGIEAFIKLMYKYNNQTYGSLQDTFSKEIFKMEYNKHLYDKKGAFSVPIIDNKNLLNSKLNQFGKLYQDLEQNKLKDSLFQYELFSINKILEVIYENSELTFSDEIFAEVRNYMKELKVVLKNDFYISLKDTLSFIKFLLDKLELKFKDINFMEVLNSSVSFIPTKKEILEKTKIAVVKKKTLLKK